MSKVFGYEEMLKVGKPFSPTDEQLDDLAKFITDERERIPAGYVYFGQFVDHDITAEQRVNGKPNDPFAAAIKGPGELINHRTPFLNLETIYGFETSQHGEPTRRDLLEPGSATILRLGNSIAGNLIDEEFEGRDLYRGTNNPFALLVDKRDDENLVVAQTHVLFVRFHNAVVRRTLGGSENDPGVFDAARKIVIQHYQWIVLNDLLRQVLKSSVLADVLENGNRFYFPDPQFPPLPLEFTVAAFRLGHSMVASNYNWNRLFNNDPFSDHLANATLMDLQGFTGAGGLGGFARLPSDWLINWNWFHDVGNQQGQKLNRAEPIDTKLARFTMPTIEYDRNSSLAARDLFRVRKNGLPTGQEVASVIHGTSRKVIRPEQMDNLLPPHLRVAFSRETPLWFYLLAEAEIEEQGYTFGEVGSRIMAEVFVKLIELSEYSILEDGFRPRPEWCDSDGNFGMPQLLRFVANGNEAELDPIGPLELPRIEILKARFADKIKRRM